MNIIKYFSAGLFCLALVSSIAPAVAGAGGGCAGCTLVVALLEQKAIYNGLSVTKAVGPLCADIAGSNSLLNSLCALALGSIAPGLEKDFGLGLSPEQSCATTLAACKNYPQCRLFKKWPPVRSQAPGFAVSAVAGPARRLAHMQQELAAQGKIADINSAMLSKPEQWFELMSTFVNPTAASELSSKIVTARQQQLGGGDIPVANHLPLVDDDKDTFSTLDTLRGAHWRGKDCNDKDARVYPGRAIDSVGDFADHNCNGILGRDSQGSSYERKFCKNSGQRGLIVLGDSAAAHFSLPPQWFDVRNYNNKTFANLIDVLTDEGDVPHCSAYTGFMNETGCPPSKVPIKSLYQRLVERNRCNHRDFQNIAVNGARTGSMAPPEGIVTTMKSRSTNGNDTDQPAIVFLALIGNDVCNGHAGYDSMTTPEAFERNVLSTLAYLDEHLAAGSHVMTIGLVDGRVLYNAMHAREHPIGAGVTYSDFYDALNCWETNPCWGWLNTDATARDKTTARAMQLNDVYKKIASTRSYKKFQLHHYYADMQKHIDDWVAKGNAASDLVEPGDGFHPSQTALGLVSEALWKTLETEYPEVIGPVNPFNAEIQRTFGNQGGY